MIRHVGLSNASCEQLRAASEIVEIAAVTAHYNVGSACCSHSGRYRERIGRREST